VTISQATVTGTGFSISGLSLPLTLAGGQSTTFQAKFAPTTTGSVTGSISIVSNASNSPTNVSLSGTGLRLLLSATPSSIDFGNVALGSEATLGGVMETHPVAVSEEWGVFSTIGFAGLCLAGVSLARRFKTA
jgi:hypothetical protein